MNAGNTAVAQSLDRAEARYRQAGRADEADVFARQSALLTMAAKGEDDPAKLRAASRRIKRGQ